MVNSRHIQLRLIAGLLGLSLSFVSCTRKGNESSSLSLSIPSNFNSLTTSNKLQIVIVNLKIPNQPVRVEEFEYGNHGGTAAAPTIYAGETFDLVIPEVPKSSGILVQVLAVFQDATSGTMVFQYDDTTVDLSGGDATATISPKVIGSSTRQGRVQGRYLVGGTSIADAYGPTGTLVTYYNPPDGKPSMAVNRTRIYNGWFNVFVLDGTNTLTYQMDETGAVLFDGVNLSSTVFNPTTDTSALVKFSKPQSYRPSGNSDPQMDLIQGFFLAASATSLSSSLFKACYPQVTESIPNMMAEAALASQVKFSPSSGSSADFRISSATAIGYGQSISNMYTATATCGWDLGTTMFYHHRFLNGGYDQEPFGVRGPFRLVDPFENYGGYLRQTFSASTAVIGLKWAYLPGVTATTALGGAAVEGAYVYGKYSTSGSSSSGGGDKSQTCDQWAAANGFEFVADVPAANTTYSFSGSVGGSPSLTAANAYGFRFSICPYRTVTGTTAATTTKVFVLDSIQTSCMSGSGASCGDLDHYGWGITSPSTITSPTTYAALGGKAFRLTNVIPNQVQSGSDFTYTKLVLTPTPAPSIVAGDELMVQVVGQGPTSPCKASADVSISTGDVDFVRVLGVSGSYVMIARGSFVDNLSNTALAVSSYYSTDPFCSVQLSKVLHFSDLTIGSGGKITGVPFIYGSQSGGALPIRVNGQLHLLGGTPLSMDGSGFQGGYFTGPFAGAGATGDRGTATPSTDGGRGGSVDFFGGGGAGYGNGGTATSSGGIGGTGGTTGYWNATAAMGAGGGSAYGTFNGGDGGGYIFLAARNIDLQGSSILSANGGQGSFDSTRSGGGGGGGRVYLVSQRIVQTTAGATLSLSAKGGDVDASGNNSAGAGSGGGGSAIANVCSGSSAVAANVTAGMFMAAGTEGGVGLAVQTPVAQLGICQWN